MLDFIPLDGVIADPLMRAAAKGGIMLVAVGLLAALGYATVSRRSTPDVLSFYGQLTPDEKRFNVEPAVISIPRVEVLYDALRQATGRIGHSLRDSAVCGTALLPHGEVLHKGRPCYEARVVVSRDGQFWLSVLTTEYSTETLTNPALVSSVLQP